MSKLYVWHYTPESGAPWDDSPWTVSGDDIVSTDFPTWKEAMRFAALLIADEAACDT